MTETEFILSDFIKRHAAYKHEAMLKDAMKFYYERLHKIIPLNIEEYLLDLLSKVK